MKKAFFIFIAVAALALQSCLHDNKTVFDEPAAERLDKAVADYTALTYPSGIVLIPASVKEGNLFGEGSGSMIFTWDEDTQRAEASDGGQIEGHEVDSFFGVAYGENLQPLTTPDGKYVYAFMLEAIEHMTKIK